MLHKGDGGEYLLETEVTTSSMDLDITFPSELFFSTLEWNQSLGHLLSEEMLRSTVY